MEYKWSHTLEGLEVFLKIRMKLKSMDIFKTRSYCYRGVLCFKMEREIRGEV